MKGIRNNVKLGKAWCPKCNDVRGYDNLGCYVCATDLPIKKKVLD